jgi:hypothetical protein
MVEVMPEDRIARLMTIRDLVSAGQQAPARPALPDNTLRNNDTGATYSFQSQAPGASYQADYANPIEIAGAGRGYRIKGDPLAAIINGQRVDFGVDGAASRQRQKENLSLMAAQQGIQSGALDIQEKQRAAQMGKRPSLPPGYAWSEDGTRAVQIPGLEDVAKPLTTDQSKTAGYALRAEEADKIINSIGRDGAVQPGMIKRMGEAVPFIGGALGTALNFTQSPEQQQIEQAQRNFINAVLRPESGAVINQDEFDNARKQYFPQPSDGPDVIAQKAKNRRTSIEGIANAAAPSFREEFFGTKKPGLGVGLREGGKGGEALPDPLGIR